MLPRSEKAKSSPRFLSTHLSIAHVLALHNTAEPFIATPTHHKPHIHWEYPTNSSQLNSNEGPYTPSTAYKSLHKYLAGVTYKIVDKVVKKGHIHLVINPTKCPLHMGNVLQSVQPKPVAPPPEEKEDDLKEQGRDWWHGGLAWAGTPTSKVKNMVIRVKIKKGDLAKKMGIKKQKSGLPQPYRPKNNQEINKRVPTLGSTNKR